MPTARIKIPWVNTATTSLTPNLQVSSSNSFCGDWVFVILLRLLWWILGQNIKIHKNCFFFLFIIHNHSTIFHSTPHTLSGWITNGCETWSLTLKEEHRLSVFENRELRRLFGPKRGEVTGGWRNCIVRSCMVCTLHQILLERSHQGWRDGWGI
jgi:hypothetical protein